MHHKRQQEKKKEKTLGNSNKIREQKIWEGKALEAILPIYLSPPDFSFWLTTKYSVKHLSTSQLYESVLPIFYVMTHTEYYIFWAFRVDKVVLSFYKMS